MSFLPGEREDFLQPQHLSSAEAEGLPLERKVGRLPDHLRSILLSQAVRCLLLISKPLTDHRAKEIKLIFFVLGAFSTVPLNSQFLST